MDIDTELWARLDCAMQCNRPEHDTNMVMTLNCSFLTLLMKALCEDNLCRQTNIGSVQGQ